MTARLKKAVHGAKEEVGEALAEAEAELAKLRAKEQELTMLIGEAHRLLGSADGSSVAGPIVPERPRTLHEAMKLVLTPAGEEGLPGRQLADAINRRGLYHRRDGASLQANQVYTRAHRYPKMFEKLGGRIRLRGESKAE